MTEERPPWLVRERTKTEYDQRKARRVLVLGRDENEPSVSVSDDRSKVVRPFQLYITQTKPTSAIALLTEPRSKRVKLTLPLLQIMFPHPRIVMNPIMQRLSPMQTMNLIRNSRVRIISGNNKINRTNPWISLQLLSSLSSWVDSPQIRSNLIRPCSKQATTSPS